MATVNYYVLPDGAGTKTGENWDNAFEGIQAAINEITDIVTDEIVIYVGGDTGSPSIYTDDVNIVGIKLLGEEASLVIQTGSNSDTTWNNTFYLAADKSPFDDSALSGTWDIKEDTRPVIITGKISIEDTNRVEIRGFKFDSDDDEACLRATSGGNVKAVYCHFYGEDCSAQAMGNSSMHLENCCFQENRVAVMCVGKSWVTMEGDNYIENAWQCGIYAMIEGYVQVSPWDEHPLEYFTTEIKTTGGRKKYYAVKAIEKSFIKVWNGWEEYDIEIGHMKIYHTSDKISANYYGVALESMSLLTGDEKIDFLMKNTKGEDVEMPSARQVIVDGTSSAD